MTPSEGPQGLRMEPRCPPLNLQPSSPATFVPLPATMPSNERFREQVEEHHHRVTTMELDPSNSRIPLRPAGKFSEFLEKANCFIRQEVLAKLALLLILGA